MRERADFQPIRNVIEGCWPGEWGTDPIGDQSNCTVYRATDIDDEGHLSLANGADRVVIPSKLAVKALRKGDLLLEASGGAPDRPVGRVALVATQPSKPSLTSNFFRFMRPKANVDPTFLTFQLVALNRSSAIWRYQQQTTGLINLKVYDYLGHPVWTPPLPTQQRIAAILTTIDTAIEQTEALIEKYQHIKAGLMHDLFTRGVLPNGQLRPPREQAPELYRETAIGWIPREWKSVNLSSVANLTVGFAFKSEWFVADGINLLRGENVGYGAPDWQDRQCLNPGKQNSFTEYLLNPGDVVIGMDRTFTKSGVKITQLAAIDCPALLVQRVGKFVAINCDTQYLRWLVVSSGYLRSLFNQQKGMDIPHLSKSEILEPVVPVPNKNEQSIIASQVQGIADLIKVADAHLRKLTQQKLGLMQDLLTGKVAVAVDSPENAAYAE